MPRFRFQKVQHMFQTFDAATKPEDGPPRLDALRIVLNTEGLDGFLIPRADAHQGEYVAPRDERLAWLTGFTGSAGFCAAMKDRAGVFVDGRYRVQVKSQVADVFTPVNWPETPLEDWLKEALPNGGVVGFDPQLHTVEQLEKLSKALAGTGITLSETGNLVDRIWADQPAPPLGKITPYPIGFAGEAHSEKLLRIAGQLRDAGQWSAVLTLPDSIAWLLNIRGSDIARTPVAHVFAILHDDGRLTLYCNPAKCDEALLTHLGDLVTVRPLKAFAAGLRSLIGPVRVDKASAPLWVSGQLAEAGIEVAWGQDPCILPKATKSAAEITATTAAHLRDGAAMCEFLAWLDATAPHERLTEIDVVTELEVHRRAADLLRDISFETIAGAGPNGAIVHYRVSKDSNRVIEPGQLLLIDSGGQYLDGTTDITRTIPIGDVGTDEKRCFTRVLQGMIAVSRVRFPKGIAGRDLDALARYPLWLEGKDYDHGTGHGVGVFLGVHEGPQRISRLSHVPLKPGMILSNEPGYYREGAFGIRIENLIVVREAPEIDGGDTRDMLSFDTLTYVPIDRRLIVSDLLSTDERDWINAYHTDVYDKISPLLSKPSQLWLKQACALI